MITGKLKNQVDAIWQVFWTGGITVPTTVIAQFTYLLFIRQLDEQQQKEEKKAALVGVPIKNAVFTESQTDLRWSRFKNEDPKTMLSRFTVPNSEGLTVFDHMKQVGGSNSSLVSFMADATFAIKDARVLDSVVQKIDELDLKNRDAKGDLYEYMLSKLASAGTNGQFRTPRHILRMMVDMVQPKRDEVICDPAGGSAGFLISAAEYFRDNHHDWFHEAGFRAHFEKGMFHGIEQDGKMAEIGAMNIHLHGIDTQNWQHSDSLGESVSHIRDKYTLILANPPFTGTLDYGAVDSSVLDLVKSKKSELLFLGLFLRMLKTGGRCAAIVPDGVLTGSTKGHKQIREEIVARHKLEAVVSLPSGVFKPYAGVSTAILFFTKTGTGGTDHVWFYDMEADGYSLNDKRDPIAENDIPDIVNRFQNLEAESSRARTEKSFMVPFAEIASNHWDLGFKRYKEFVYEEIVYAPPMEIISEIEALEEERQRALANLKSMLS